MVLKYQTRINSIAITPDGTNMAIGGLEILAVELPTMKSIREFQFDQVFYGQHTGGEIRLAYSPDGTTLASTHCSSRVYFWDREKARPRTNISHIPLPSWPRCLAWHRNSKMLAVGTNEGNVLLLDVESGDIITEECDGHKGFVTDVSFSTNGNQMVSVGLDGFVRWWDVQRPTKPELLLSLHSGDRYLYTAKFSVDSRYLLFGGSSKVVHVFDLKTIREVGQLKGHLGFIMALAISSNNELLASASSDYTVRVWDYRKGKELYVYKGHGCKIVTSVGFVARSKEIVSASPYENMPRIWTPTTIR